MNLTELEKEREKILKKIHQLGDMRSGSLSVRYQQCSKGPCVCHEPGHPGHGPIYSFSTLVNGKTKIKNFKLSAELEKVRKEVETYQVFKQLSHDLIEVNNTICELRPVPHTADILELEELKKNLQRCFMKKYKRRLTGS
jgi:hypothetical protein